MAVMPKVIKKIVASDRTIIHDGTRSKRLLKKISSSPSKNSGMKFNQNLLQSTDLRPMGRVCRSQKDFPSKLIAGKAKRIAMEPRTNPPRPRLAKETNVLSGPPAIGERSSGRTLKL